MTKKDFKVWFEKAYIEWRNNQEDRKANISRFSEWLRIPVASVSQYLNGYAIPEGENLFRIATKLGFEVYDLLGYSRPDRALKEWQALYDITPPADREELLRMAQDWLKKKGLESND
jgi:hypothetical protein